MSLLIRLIILDVKFVLGDKGLGKVENFILKRNTLVKKYQRFLITKWKLNIFYDILQGNLF